MKEPSVLNWLFFYSPPETQYFRCYFTYYSI